MMKNTRPNIVWPTFLIGLLFLACNSNSYKIDAAKMEMVENPKKTNNFRYHYEVELKSFQMESIEKITTNKGILIASRIKSKNLEEPAKSQYIHAIDALEKRNQMMNKRMLNYSDFTNDKWQFFKLDFTKDMDNLSKAIVDLSAF
jgi:hypothetical protein